MRKEKSQVVVLEIVEMMTSREIAELTGKEHRMVLRDIRVMLEQLDEAASDNDMSATLRSCYEVTTYLSKGHERTMYKLNKRLAFILMSKYSILFLDAVVSRWEKLEIEAAAVNTINLKREEVRQLERSCARIDCPVMAEAIMQCNIRAGKSLKFIYSNEHNMIYRIVLGMTYKEYLVFNGLPENADIRDVLSGDEIELVKKLQREVTTLADLDIIYRDRKELLNKKYSRLKVEKRLANK